MNAVHHACLGNGKASAWILKANVHCLDLDGRRQEYWQRGMNGTNVMIKFMVPAHEQMFDLFDIAKNSASWNPYAQGFVS